MNKTILLLSAVFFFASCKKTEKPSEENTTISTDSTMVKTVDKANYLLEALQSTVAPIIDGDSMDFCWENQSWYPINNIWLGNEYTDEDFAGRFKLAWDSTKLYLLVEIKDDILIDKYEKWDSLWWNDDCVEIFLDEDNGDDLHQFNHKAFAYHVALNCQDVVDLGPDSLPHLYNDHLKAAKQTSGNNTIWEFAINIYDDQYRDGHKNTPVTLMKGKKMGFCLNYCDSDTSALRENFISSIPVVGEDKDQGWKDAGVFNDLILK